MSWWPSYGLEYHNRKQLFGDHRMTHETQAVSQALQHKNTICKLLQRIASNPSNSSLCDKGSFTQNYWRQNCRIHRSICISLRMISSSLRWLLPMTFTRFELRFIVVTLRALISWLIGDLIEQRCVY